MIMKAGFVHRRWTVCTACVIFVHSVSSPAICTAFVASMYE